MEIIVEGLSQNDGFPQNVALISDRYYLYIAETWNFAAAPFLVFR